MKHARISEVLSLIGALSVPAVAQAELGNLSYTQQELFTSVSLFNASNMPNGPSGSNTVVFIHGLLVVMGSNDSGKPPGTYHVFDVKDPRKPVHLKAYASALSANNREQHAMPMAMIDGKFILAAPQTGGVAFFDFTDPMNPKDVGSLNLNGVNGGDYDNVAWELSWSWPYLFVGGSGSGLYIVDATDPAKPTLVNNAPMPTGQLGNFRVGPVHAAGNYVTVASMDQNPTGVSILDASNPKAPFLLTKTTVKSVYSSLTIGDMIFGVGENASYTFLKWTPDAITTVAEKTYGTDKGGYCTYQDGYGFCGQSKDGFFKLDLRTYDAANIKQVGNGKPAGAATSGGDFDFATVVGNLVYLGNDHGTGASLIPHSMTPDTTAPSVLKVYPLDRATKQALTSRVTIFFTDEIDTDTVGAGAIIVRKAGGMPLAGVLSHSSFNAISFGPKQPLEANSTYEVVVHGGMVKDLSGNTMAGESISRFSTGTTIDPGPDGGGSGGPPPVDAGRDTGAGAGAGGASAGAGGSGAAGSTGSAGTGSVGAGGAPATTSSGLTTTTGTGGVGVGAGGSSTTAGPTTTTGTSSSSSSSSSTGMDTSTGTGSSVATGSGGSGGTGAGGSNRPGNPMTDGGSCGCRAPGSQTARGSWFLLVLAFGIGTIRRRGSRFGA